MIASDRRRHPRKLVDVPVVVQVRDGEQFQANLGQMSIGGSFIDTEQRPLIGTELMLLFRLPGGPTEFEVSAVVRWSAPTGVGVQFGAMRAREIYELSRFLVDKTTLPPPAPLPRSPVRAALPTRPHLPRTERTPPPLPARAATAAAEPERTATPPAVAGPLPATEPSAPPVLSEQDGFKQRIAQLEAQLAAQTTRSRSLDVVLAERDARLRSLEPAVGERDERVRGLEAAVGERDARLRSLEAVVGERDERVRGLEAAVGERDARIRSLEAACADAASKGSSDGDELTRLRGVGPAFARVLREHGIRRYEQIASWTEADLERIAGELKVPATRIRRSDWVGHARTLIAERTAALATTASLDD